MADGKKFKSTKKDFVKGGSKGMFGKQSAVKQKSGTSATASGSKSKWPGKLGGGGKMFGKQTSKGPKSC
jgi:hypothetical protein